MLVFVEKSPQESDNVGMLRVVLEDIHLCPDVFLLVQNGLHHLHRGEENRE